MQKCVCREAMMMDMCMTMGMCMFSRVLFPSF